MRRPPVLPRHANPPGRDAKPKPLRKPAPPADKHPSGESDIRLCLLLASFKTKDVS